MMKTGTGPLAALSFRPSCSWSGIHYHQGIHMERGERRESAPLILVGIVAALFVVWFVSDWIDAVKTRHAEAAAYAEIHKNDPPVPPKPPEPPDVFTPEQRKAGSYEEQKKKYFEGDPSAKLGSADGCAVTRRGLLNRSESQITGLERRMLATCTANGFWRSIASAFQ
jgi:hypothetical protein